jgi:hypothetical protein
LLQGMWFNRARAQRWNVGCFGELGTRQKRVYNTAMCGVKSEIRQAALDERRTRRQPGRRRIKEELERRREGEGV